MVLGSAAGCAVNTQNAHPHRLFVPEQFVAVAPPPAVRERLAQLRAEALARAQAMCKRAPDLFVKPKTA